VFGSDTRIVINTKCGNHPFAGKDFRISALEASLDQSLTRLRRDRVHALFLHNPRTDLPDMGPALGFLQGEKHRQRIELAGVSGAKGYAYAPAVRSEVDAFQDDVNLLYLESIRTQPRPRCFYARSPLASGILSGRITAETRFDPTDHRASWLKGERLISLTKRVDVIRMLTAIPVPSLARRFVLQLPEVDKVIFGIKRPQHVQDLVADLTAEPLPGDLMQSLTRLVDEDFGLAGERRLGF
jgi:aryl-alcohol dehydrogenase-like predicted oxidoreductase